MYEKNREEEFAKLESFNKQFINDQKLNQKNKRPCEREAKEDEIEQKTQRAAALKKMLTMKMNNDVKKEINLEEEFKNKANQDKLEISKEATATDISQK